MTLLIPFAVVAVPVGEVAFFVMLAGQIGWLMALAALFLFATAGIAILRWQGLSALRSVQATTAAGEIPALVALESLGFLFAGALFLLPGFLSDVVGFLLLVPAVRRALARRLATSFAAQDHGFLWERTFPGAHPHPAAGGGPIIDGEFVEIHPAGEGGSGAPGPKTGERDNRTPSSRALTGRAPTGR